MYFSIRDGVLSVRVNSKTFDLGRTVGAATQRLIELVHQFGLPRSISFSSSLDYPADFGWLVEDPFNVIDNVFE